MAIIEATQETAFTIVDHALERLEERVAQILGASVCLERLLLVPLPREAPDVPAEVPPVPDPIMPQLAHRLHGILAQANDAYGILQRLDKELSH